MTNWKQSSKETMDKAEFIYGELRNISDNPEEAAHILIVAYVNLWFEGKTENGNVDTMLSMLCSCIKLNIEVLQRRDLQ